MAEKKLKISLDIDDRAFVSAVKRMQDQINQLQSPANLLRQQQQISQKMQSMGLGPLPGALSARQVEQEQQRAKQQSDKIFEETRRKMEIIKRLQIDLNKEQSSGVSSEQRKLEIQERLIELKKQELRTTGELTTLVNRPGGGGAGGGGILGTRGGTIASDPLKAVGGIIAAAGTAFIASQLAQQVENIRRSFTESGYRATELQAASIAQAGAPGAQFGALYGGKSMEEFLFRGERGKAHAAAEAQMRGRLGGPLAAILRPRQTLMAAFGTEDQQRLVQKEQQQEFYDLQARQYEALKGSPEGLKKMAAFQQFQGNFQGYLGTQRMLGLDYSTFHGPGGFRAQAAGAGFTDEMASKMAEQIISAGGSTRMGRGSVLALQAQRGFDVSNAGNVLGTISQTLGSVEQSKSAFIKMLAEGSKLGLDSSQFREENRKFLDATAQVVSRSETSRLEDIEDIVKRFGGFVGEPTTRGIQAAQGAFQAFTQITSANTGPQGVMRAAGFLKDEVIGGMSPMDRASLSTIPTDQLSADHPVIQSLARKYKQNPEDLVSRVRKSGAAAIHRLPEGDALTKSLIAKRSAAQGPWSPTKLEAMSGEISAQEQDLAKIVALEYPEMAKNRKQLEAFVKGTTQPVETGRTDFFEKYARGKLEAPVTGRPEDEMVRGMAQDTKAILESFQALRQEIVPAADELGKFNDKIKENLELTKQAPAAKKTTSDFWHPAPRGPQPQSGKQ